MKRVLKIVGAIVLALVVVALAALAITEGERREGRNLPIADVDFSAVPDGVYDGAYEGGKYGWRANKVQVTVSSGRVTEIAIVKSANAPVPQLTGPLFDHVIEAQSLQVDAVSGATITSKAFLKSVEDALLSASEP